MFCRFTVRKDQRAILFQKGDFVRVLEAGETRMWDLFGDYSVEMFDLAAPLFQHRLVPYLRAAEPEMLERYFTVMDLNDDEVGLRYENDLLAEILAPGTRRLYWKGVVDQRLERIALAEDYTIGKSLISRLLQPALKGRTINGANGVLIAQIPAFHVGILKVDGEVVRLLPSGVAAFWRFNRDIAVDIVDTRLQAMEVTGQEILTRDKVGLRLNLAATWQFTDVLVAFSKAAKPSETLYRDLQFGLREAVGTRTLDELLENKQVIDQTLKDFLAPKLEGLGIAVTSLGVKDIILPGEMKTILAQVVEAEKAAQANVIRRREETAATRSLLNTARVMEDNPVALRLKELETLERVAERIDQISVYGGPDQVLNGLVTIRPPAA